VSVGAALAALVGIFVIGIPGALKLPGLEIPYPAEHAKSHKVRLFSPLVHVTDGTEEIQRPGFIWFSVNNDDPFCIRIASMEVHAIQISRDILVGQDTNHWSNYAGSYPQIRDPFYNPLAGVSKISLGIYKADTKPRFHNCARGSTRIGDVNRKSYSIDPALKKTSFTTTRGLCSAKYWVFARPCWRSAIFFWSPMRAV